MRLVFVCVIACVNPVSFKVDVFALAIRPRGDRHDDSLYRGSKNTPRAHSLIRNLPVLCIDAFDRAAHETDEEKTDVWYSVKARH